MVSRKNYFKRFFFNDISLNLAFGKITSLKEYFWSQTDMKIPLYLIGILVIGIICKHSMTKYLLVEVGESGGSNVPATAFDGQGGSNFLGKPFARKKCLAH